MVTRSGISGIYCPATRGRCDRPCLGAECQRVKLFGLDELLPRPPPPDTRPIILPAQLRAARAYLDCTLEQMQEKVGVSADTLGAFERGDRVKPQEKTLRKIIGALYELGIEVFGTDQEPRGIRDFLPIGRPK